MSAFTVPGTRVVTWRGRTATLDELAAAVEQAASGKELLPSLVAQTSRPEERTEPPHTPPALGGRSVVSLCAGRGQRTLAQANTHEPVGAVHPCARAVHTVPPLAASSTEPAGPTTCGCPCCGADDYMSYCTACRGTGEVTP